MADVLPKATPADAKAVWDAMEAAGEKPSLGNVAKRLSAAFAKPSKETIRRWKDAGWVVKEAQSHPPPNEEAKSKLNTAVAISAGDPLAAAEDLAPLADDCKGKPLADLVRIAAEEQFLTLIATARYTRRLIEQGVVEITTDEKTGEETRTNEPVKPAVVGGLVSALAGSFSTSTSVADKARDLGMKDVTPANDGTKIIEGEVLTPEDELADVMAKVAAAGNAAPTD